MHNWLLAKPSLVQFQNVLYTYPNQISQLKLVIMLGDYLNLLDRSLLFYSQHTHTYFKWLVEIFWKNKTINATVARQVVHSNPSCHIFDKVYHIQLGNIGVVVLSTY